MASLSKSIAVKPFLMKTVSESHLIDDDASSQNGAGKQVPALTKTIKTSVTRVSFGILAKHFYQLFQTSLEDSLDFGARRSWDQREGNTIVQTAFCNVFAVICDVFAMYLQIFCFSWDQKRRANIRQVYTSLILLKPFYNDVFLFLASF